jgi:hypothetical protein
VAKIKWLGDVDNPGTTLADAYCTWNEIMFPLGKPVETSDPHMIAKARHNRFFSVDDEPTRERLPTMMDYLPVDEEPPEVFGPERDYEPEEFAREMSKPPIPPKRKRGRPPKVKEQPHDDS